MKRKIRVNILFPAVSALLSAVWIYKGILEYGLWDEVSKSPKDGFFPSLIALVLLIISILNMISSLKEKPVTFEKNALYLTGALALIYIATNYIGFLPALLFFYVLWLKLYAKTNWKTTALATFIMVVIVYFGFVVGLQIRFPKGLLFNKLG